MNIYFHLLVLAFYLPSITFAQNKEIIFEGSLQKSITVDTVYCEVISPYDFADYHLLDNEKQVRVFKTGMNNNEFKFKFKTSQPVLIYIYTTRNVILNEGLSSLNLRYLIEPNDSIRVDIDNSMNRKFSGRGVDKFNLADKRDFISRKLKIGKTSISALEKYYLVSKFQDSISNVLEDLLNQYKSRVSDFAYQYYKAEFLSSEEHHRANAFTSLLANRKKLNISGTDLAVIFDETIGKAKVLSLPLNETTLLTSLAFYHGRVYNPLYYYRSLLFDESLQKDEVTYYVNYYKFVKSNYTDLARVKILTTALTKYMIKKGHVPEYNECVEDFMQIPGYSLQKDYVMAYRNSHWALDKGEIAPNFKLKNELGEDVSLSVFKDKIIFLDFWFTGCKGCIQVAKSLRKIEQKFIDNKNIVFISISVDKNKETWKKSIKEKKYTAGGLVNLYTEGKGLDHIVIKDYSVSSFPQMFIIGPDQAFAAYPAPDPRTNEGSNLVEFLERQLAILEDGPYVNRKGNRLFVNYIKSMDGYKKAVKDTIDFNEKREIYVNVQADIKDEQFAVKIKNIHSTEPCVFPKINKLLVLSDIEGNFMALKKLLMANGVIDRNYNWTFGKGHIVLNGDLFDRGLQVTEVLWLIYSLEDKAKREGGYVHYILGNHELMNLNDRLDYVQHKYINNARLLGVGYSSFWSHDTELGKWLRTKNIIEKIGDDIFVHGGIPAAINSSRYGIVELNDIIRPYYDEEKLVRESKDTFLLALFRSATSPFWYRDYYSKNEITKAKQSEIILNSLLKFKAKRIITGHTIVSDTVSVHYDGKVINVDTHHESGKSEALFIENNSYFRSNQLGVKTLLFMGKSYDVIKE